MSTYFSGPEIGQLETLALLIEIMPTDDATWLSENGNLEYYIESYGRAQALIEKLRNDIDKQ